MILKQVLSFRRHRHWTNCYFMRPAEFNLIESAESRHYLVLATDIFFHYFLLQMNRLQSQLSFINHLPFKGVQSVNQADRKRRA